MITSTKSFSGLKGSYGLRIEREASCVLVSISIYVGLLRKYSTTFNNNIVKDWKNKINVKDFTVTVLNPEVRNSLHD